MTDHHSAHTNNFIRQIIDEDLKNGVHEFIKTRFPPEPNGYLHIGHAKSICLNFDIAEDYNGACNLRFDDTNPLKEDILFVDSIQQDVSWLGFEWSGEPKYSSDYFQQLFDFAMELVGKGLAYVDFSDQDTIRAQRGTLTEAGVESAYRDTSVADNMAHFQAMANGKYAEGSACLRAKIDMSSSFMCMRDPILYRVRFAHHHQTGDRWCIYPMYDFAHCLSDAIEGITHSLCTLEFQDNRRLYDWIIDHVSVPARPRQYEFSRLNLEYTVLSKRRLIELVEGQHVSGWDDPRMPTIAGLRRRGYTPASIREFCRRIGVTKMDNRVEMSMLEACIRDELNVRAPRRMAVLNPLEIIIEGMIGETVLTVANHPSDETMGTREMVFGPRLYIDKDDFRESANKHFKRLVLGKEVRLRNAYVIKAERIETDASGEITRVYCSYDKDTLGKDPSDGRKVKGVIQWVNADHGLPATFRIYDRLFKQPNPNAVEDFLSGLNEYSLRELSGVVEPSLQVAAVGFGYQFERVGYFCADPDSQPRQLVFNQTVGLRDSWAKLDDKQ